MERRQFLRSLSLAGAGAAALGSLPPAARRAIAAIRNAPPGLIVRNDWPEHWETTVEALARSSRTPNSVFFVRSHHLVPDVRLESWKLEVAGLARTPLSLSLADLRALPAREQECVLECAGNGRARYPLPSTSGTQWQLGAVGNALWGGTRLAAVLERAGVPPEAKHVWFECADHAPLDATPRFLRSIPIETAMSDALLAWTMNGAPLPLLHGAPVRVIVPGWFGMASAKWVTRIRLEAAPSDNHFMVRGYRYNYPGVDPAAAEPVESLRVKSLITSPLDGARLPVDPSTSFRKLVVRGWAWGSAPVARVDVQIGVGKLNQVKPARLAPSDSRWAWRPWEASFDVPHGEVRIFSRATDERGDAQPLTARLNAGGYGNNSVHQLTVHA